MKPLNRLRALYRDTGDRGGNFRAFLMFVLLALGNGLYLSLDMGEWWPMIGAPLFLGLLAGIGWLCVKSVKLYGKWKWKRFQRTDHYRMMVDRYGDGTKSGTFNPYRSDAE